MATRTQAEAKSTSTSIPAVPPAHFSLLPQQEQEEPDRAILPSEDRLRSPSSPTPPPINPLTGHSFGTMAIGPTPSLVLQQMAIAHHTIQRQENPENEETPEEEPIQAKAIAPFSATLLQRQEVTEEQEKNETKFIQAKTFPGQGLTHFSQGYGQKEEVTETAVQSAPRIPMLQRKLTIGQPNDQYEQEAARESEQMMRMPKTPIQYQIESEEKKQGILQRDEVSNRVTTPAPLRSGMEASFNTNFSNVRIHPNSSHASAMEALAYTQGNDIYFAPGQFQPHTPHGQKLIGHELAHVMQQQQGRVVATGELNGQAINSDSILEQEADDFGEKAAAQMQFTDLAKIEAQSTELGIASFTSPAQRFEDPNKPVLDTYKGKSINKIGHVSAPANQYEIARTQGVNVRAKPDGTLPPIAKVIYNTEVHVQALDNTSAFYFIISKTGEVGWINKDYVALDRPDIGSRLHHITESNLTTILKTQYVDKGLWTLSSGNDYTTLAAAVVVANKGREGIFVDWEKAQKYKDENTLKSVLDPWMIDNFAIYHGSTVLKGHNIWLPSPNFVRMLQRSGAIGSRPGWINEAVEIGKGIAGFLEGVISGIFGSLWETLTGLWDLGKSIISTIKSVLDGSLFASIESIYDTVANMTWEDFKKLVNDLITMGQSAFNNFAEQWNHPNAYKKWHFRGYTIGAIALEIVLAIFTGGATLGAKVLAKIGKYFPKLMRVLNKLLDIADDLHIRRRDTKRHADKPDKDHDRPERNKDEDLSDKDRAWEQARIMATIITEEHDAIDTPISILIPLLNTTIAARFKGVSGYSAIRKGPPNTYRIIQRTRRTEVDNDYTEKQNELPPELQGLEKETNTVIRTEKQAGVRVAEDHHIATIYRERNKKFFKKYGLDADQELNLIRNFEEHGQLRGYYIRNKKTGKLEYRMRGHHPEYHAWVTETLESCVKGKTKKEARQAIRETLKKLSDIVKKYPEVLAYGPEIFGSSKLK